MLKQRRMAADQVAASLFEAEAAIDAALNKAAALTAAIPVARTGAGLSALFCQDALESLSETIAALASARRGIVSTHKQLAVVKVQMGLGAARMDGGGGSKPPAIAPAAMDLAAQENVRPLRRAS